MGLTITSRPSGSGRDGPETFRLSRPAPGSSSVLIQADATDVCRLPRLVDAPEIDHAPRVAATLESACVDVPFQNALPVALWLLEHTEALAS
jgi:hypothetical protein